MPRTTKHCTAIRYWRYVMPVDFKFKLDTSSKKFECPNCGKKTFVRYRDEDGNYCDEKFGRCDRENNCNYLLIPENEKIIVPPKPNTVKPIQYIDFDDAVATSCNYQDNPLMMYLVSKVGIDAVDKMITEYRVGIDQTNPNTRDWVIWWQFDASGLCRSGKMMKYGHDGRRDKNHSSTWYHKVNPKYEGFELTQCFFGEHLIKQYPGKRIAIVESEKTAIIASHFMPDYIWLASGQSTGLGWWKAKALKNRSVTLFPDLGMFDHPRYSWKEKAKEYGWNISRVLEDRATDEERKQGLDIADFLF